MHAHVLAHYGSDGLVPGTMSDPTPTSGEVVVRLDAIAINPLDWKIRNGWLAQMIPLSLPAVIGYEGAGTIVEIGPGATRFTVGDRVAGFFDSGAYAEAAVTRESRLTAVPEGLSIAQAAALPTAAETATRIYGMLRPAPHSTVVVNGAAGAVGSMITQLLVRDGHRVIGTVGAANHDYLRSLGAIPIGYGDELVDDLRAVAPAGADAAYDAAGHEFVDAVAGVMDPQHIVTIADFAAAEHGAIVAGGDPTQLMMTDQAREVFSLAASGTIRVAVEAGYRFEDLPKALAYNEQGHLRGKVIVAGYDREPSDIGLT